jgi:hypothetical protein
MDLEQPRSKRGDGNGKICSAFMDLEPDICDVLRAADLACQLALDEGDKIDDLVFFCIRHCQQLAADLKEKYYGLWPEH